MSPRTSPRPGRFAVLALCGVLWLAACWRPELPSMPPPPDPFVRSPYLQAVTDSSAQILWMTGEPTPDSLVYWIEEGVSPAGVGRSIAGVGPIAGGAAPSPETQSRRDTVGGIVSAASADTIRIGSGEARLRHRVTLAPLPPGADVGYRVEGSEHRFRTAPRIGRTPLRSDSQNESGSDSRTGAPGDSRTGAPSDSRDGARSDSRDGARSHSASMSSQATVTALVFGDSGLGSEGQVELARRMEELSVDLILHTGDVAYPDGTDFDLTHRHFTVYRDLLARTPFFPAIGNHDAHTDGGGPFERAFALPGMPDSERGFFGSFDWGPLHVVVLDSTGDADDDSASNLRRQGGQYRWLERDLEDAAGDPGAPWIVVVLHHPPYSSGTGLVGHGSDVELRRTLTPLFDRYGVDLVLTGHDHHYERSFPIRGGLVDSDSPGTVYIVTGGGGGSLRWRAVEREWHAAVTAFEHHFLTLQLEGSHLTLRAIGHDGRVIDQHEIRPVPPT